MSSYKQELSFAYATPNSLKSNNVIIIIWWLVFWFSVHSQAYWYGLEMFDAVEVYSINLKNILAQAFILIFIWCFPRILFPPSLQRRAIENWWIIEENL